MRKAASQGSSQRQTCHICGKAFPASKMRPWVSVRSGVSALIAQAAPGWDEGKNICKPDLARFRRQYIEQLLAREGGELTELDRQVIDSLEAGQLVSRNPVVEVEKQASFGERIADKVAEYGGSWGFILSFIVVLIAWITLNGIGLSAKPFDPYPFILLNLVLSCVAALQAPIIMMSQRRQEVKDRLRAENDYRVNLKAELEIRQLHEKIDFQLASQWEKLVELQKIQIDLLEENDNEQR